MRVIEGRNFEGDEIAISLKDENDVTIRNCTFTACRIGIAAENVTNLFIEDCNVYGGYTGANAKWQYGIRLGYSQKPDRGCTNVRIKNFLVDNLGQPDPTYQKRNSDAVTIEAGNTNVWIKALNVNTVSDACIDCKSNVAIQDLFAQNVYRAIRIWHDVTVQSKNASFLDVGERVWKHDSTGKLLDTLPNDPFFDSTDPVDPIIEPPSISKKKYKVALSALGVNISGTIEEL